MSDSVAPGELGSLFLFESLSEEKLAWLAEGGEEVRVRAGEEVYTEGEPATCFVVLLEGTIAMFRQVRGSEVEVTRTDRAGVYGGEMGALLTEERIAYSNTLRAVTDCRTFQIPVDAFGAKLRDWSPLHMHLLNGLFSGMMTSNQRVSERERLIALGSLSAGLTHELNNPAAAAARATAGLRERLVALRERSAELSGSGLAPDRLSALIEAGARADGHPEASPLEVSDREDEFGDWLDEHEVPDAYDLAATFVAVGLDTTWAERVADMVPAAALPTAMAWLAAGVEIDSLLGEITDATTRISTLLDSARQYTQMDRAPGQRADVHDLLDATLTMLKHKIGDVRVVTDYDRSLPRIEVYGAELNQVWTNLVVNALDAMEGSGTLTVRTWRDDDQAVVEIGDTGRGIPADIRPRIFEPFFSTKSVGAGTGLGLDISWRIVVKKHHGDLRVTSEPGDTRFQARLPIDGAASPA